MRKFVLIILIIISAVSLLAETDSIPIYRNKSDFRADPCESFANPTEFEKYLNKLTGLEDYLFFNVGSVKDLTVKELIDIIQKQYILFDYNFFLTDSGYLHTGLFRFFYNDESCFRLGICIRITDFSNDSFLRIKKTRDVLVLTPSEFQKCYDIFMNIKNYDVFQYKERLDEYMKKKMQRKLNK